MSTDTYPPCSLSNRRVLVSHSPYSAGIVFGHSDRPESHWLTSEARELASIRAGEATRRRFRSPPAQLRPCRRVIAPAMLVVSELGRPRSRGRIKCEHNCTIVDQPRETSFVGSS